MSNLLELSLEYRISGLACKKKLNEIETELLGDKLSHHEIIELKRNVTILTAMSRDCICTSNYLKRYHEGRLRIELRRKESGV